MASRRSSRSSSVAMVSSSVSSGMPVIRVARGNQLWSSMMPTAWTTRSGQSMMS